MSERVDASGAAYAGSQRQTQIYVNERSNELDDAIRRALSELADAVFEWRSPLAGERYAEYYDAWFLERVGLSAHSDALKQFWPNRGPHWDALAVVEEAKRANGILLVESKSYPNEFFSGGSGAKPGSESRRLIEDSLAWTQQQLGVGGRSPSDWCGRLYQYSNRLAHTMWLRSRGIQAWLVYLLFVADDRSPTTLTEWHEAIREADEELGIVGPVAGVAHVFLDAIPREDVG